MKEHVKNWSEATYKVIGIDKAALNRQTTYKLEGLNKPFLRNDKLMTFYSRIKHSLYILYSQQR